MSSSGRFRFGEGAGDAAIMAPSVESGLGMEFTVALRGEAEEYILVAVRRLCLIRSAMVGTKFSLLLKSTTADAAVEMFGIVFLFTGSELRLVEAGVKPALAVNIGSCAWVAIADAARFGRSRGFGIFDHMQFA